GHAASHPAALSPECRAGRGDQRQRGLDDAGADQWDPHAVGRSRRAVPAAAARDRECARDGDVGSDLIPSGRVTMKELPLNPRQSELLKEFDQAGGVVEYVLVDASRLSASPYELHRAVAVFGLQVVDARLTEWARKHECDGHPASMFSRVAVIPPGPV